MGETISTTVWTRRSWRGWRVDWRLLKPVEHRPEEEQAELTRIAAREALVRMRTQAVNLIRGTVKAAGGRIAESAPESLPERAKDQIPEVLRSALAPILELIEGLNEQIRECDERIEHVARTRYPEVELLTQVGGVSWLTGLTFRLTISNPWRFARSREVGATWVCGRSATSRGSRIRSWGLRKRGTYGCGACW